MKQDKMVIQALTNALAYWLPEIEPLPFQNDAESNRHKSKYYEAKRLLECVRGEYGSSLTMKEVQGLGIKQ
jgi:hypothetical protein